VATGEVRTNSRLAVTIQQKYWDHGRSVTVFTNTRPIFFARSSWSSPDPRSTTRCVWSVPIALSFLPGRNVRVSGLSPGPKVLAHPRVGRQAHASRRTRGAIRSRRAIEGEDQPEETEGGPRHFMSLTLSMTGAARVRARSPAPYRFAWKSTSSRTLRYICKRFRWLSATMRRR